MVAGRSPAEWTEAVGTQGTLPGLTLHLRSYHLPPGCLTPLSLRLCPLIAPESSQLHVFDDSTKFLCTLCSLHFPSQLVCFILSMFVDSFPLSPPLLSYFLILWYFCLLGQMQQLSKHIKNYRFPFHFPRTSSCVLQSALIIFHNGGSICSQGRASLCSGVSLTTDCYLWYWTKIGLPIHNFYFS